MGLCGFLLMLISPYRSLCILMDSYGSLLDLIGRYRSLKILMRP